MKICFCVPESTEECNPEIVAALRTVKTKEELEVLKENYGEINVIDAMFGLNAEDDSCYSLDIDHIMDWMSHLFFERILPSIEVSFLNRYNPEWVNQME